MVRSREAPTDRVAQPSIGEALYGRAEAPEYAGIPFQIHQLTDPNSNFFSHFRSMASLMP
jgi:hypothetical protein